MKQALTLLTDLNLSAEATNVLAHIIEIAYTEGKIQAVEDCTKMVNEQFGLAE